MRLHGSYSYKCLVFLICFFVLIPSQIHSKSIFSNFVNPPIEYKPKPLWFWNNTTVTEAGIKDQMQKCRDNSGYGGFGILPFGPNFTPKYLTESYFTMYGVAIKKAQELGMKLCIYDEYGFPSGSAGAINGDGTPRFQNKYPGSTIKRLDKIEETLIGPKAWSKKIPTGTLMSIVAMDTLTKERVDLTTQVVNGTISWNAPAGTWKMMLFVLVKDGDPNVDYLDPNAVDQFIGMVHQSYYDRFKDYFGTTIDGVFYDEPTMYRALGRMWTPAYNEKFLTRYGFSPTAFYPALWYNIGTDTQAARNFLFGFRTELYASGFMKRIQDWCDTHGDIYATGHQDNEDMKNPVSISGDLMKCNKFQDIPGIDKIGGGASRPAEKYYKLISSAANNWDKPLVMSETYGDMGNISWNEIYMIAMEQYTKGINMMIPHAVWYNTSNVSFLPELSYRSSIYAQRLPEFTTFMGRLNVMLQNEGRHVSDIAVLYPITTLQGSNYLDGPLGFYAGGVSTYEDNYADVGEILSSEISRDFTWIHPEILDERCTVEGDTLKLNNKVNFEAFKVLILPAHQTISWSNLQKIKQFYENGGKVIAIGKVPSKSAEFGHDQDVVETVREMFPNVSVPIKVTASSQWAAGGYEPEKVADGSMTTRWNAADQSGGNQWLEINFGGDKTFNKTIISEAFDRITSYKIQYWNGTNWANCFTGQTIGASKTDNFTAVTSPKVRLYINSIKEASASIYEFEVHLNAGPNLLTEDTLCINTHTNGGRTIFLKSPRADLLQNALDSLVQVFDVEMENDIDLRYIHKVKDSTDIYYIANTTNKSIDGYVRLRGNITPTTLDPHTGTISNPEYILVSEGGTNITRVKISLPAYHSCFIVSNSDSLFSTNRSVKMGNMPLKVFPNPIDQFLTVNFGNDIYKELNIIDMSGKIVKKMNVPDMSTEMKFDVSNLESGAYYVYLHGDTESKGTFIIK